MFTTAANQQFGVRLLMRLGEQRGFGELIIFAIESRSGLSPESEQHLEGSFKAIQALPNCVVEDPIGRMLIALPGSTYATDETSAGHDVHGRGHFRDHGGMAIGIPDDQGADPQALCGQCQAGERRPALQRIVHRIARIGHEMIGDTGSIPTGGFEMLPQRLLTGTRRYRSYP